MYNLFVLYKTAILLKDKVCILNIKYNDFKLFSDSNIKIMKVVLALVVLFAVSQASPVPGSAYDLFQNNAQDSVVS